MPTTKQLPAVQIDKALARQMQEIEADLADMEDSIDGLPDGAEKSGLERVLIDLRKRLIPAGEATDAKAAGKLLATLKPEVARQSKAASGAAVQALLRAEWTKDWERCRDLIRRSEATLKLLQPEVLRAPLEREVAQIAKRHAEAEKAASANAGRALLKALLAQLQVMETRVKDALLDMQWLRGNYVNAVAKARKAVTQVPAARCRASLTAEFDFVAAEVDKQLAKGGVKAVRAVCLPAVEKLERLAVRITAVSPAVDREFLRLGKLPAMSEGLETRLRKLVQAKGGQWPAGGSVDAMSVNLVAFEREVVKLVGDAAKEAKAHKGAEAAKSH